MNDHQMTAQMDEMSELGDAQSMAIEAYGALCLTLEAYRNKELQLSTPMLEAHQATIRAMLKPLGFRVVHLGLESYGAERRQLAMEGLGTMIMDVVKAIIGSIVRFFKWIGSFFGWCDSSSSSISSGCSSARVEHAKGEKEEEKLIEEAKKKEAMSKERVAVTAVPAAEIEKAIDSFYDHYAESSSVVDGPGKLHPAFINGGWPSKIVKKCPQLSVMDFPGLWMWEIIPTLGEVEAGTYFKQAFLFMHENLKVAEDGIKALVVETMGIMEGMHTDGRDKTTKRLLALYNGTVDGILKYHDFPIKKRETGEEGRDCYYVVPSIGRKEIAITGVSFGSFDLEDPEAIAKALGEHKVVFKMAEHPLFIARLNEDLKSKHFKDAMPVSRRAHSLAVGETVSVEKANKELKRCAEKMQEAAGALEHVKDLLESAVAAINKEITEDQREAAQVFIRILTGLCAYITNALVPAGMAYIQVGEKALRDCLKYNEYCKNIYATARWAIKERNEHITI
jgi:hypothetical protein